MTSLSFSGKWKTTNAILEILGILLYYIVSSENYKFNEESKKIFWTCVDKTQLWTENIINSFGF